MQNRIVNRSFAVLMAVVFTFASVFAAGTLNVSAATKLSVSPSSSTVSVGGSATIKSNKAVKWSVSKGSSVVKLVKKSSKSVVVKGLKEGTGYIKAKAGSSSKTVKVVVKAAKGEVTKGEAKKGRMVININLSKNGTAYAQEGKVAKVWVPIPESDNFQTISNFRYDADFTTVNKITRDSAGNKVLYLEWGANVAPEDRTARVEYSITRYAIKSTKMVEKGSIPQSIKDEYLGEFETSGSLTSGIVHRESLQERSSVSDLTMALQAMPTEMSTADVSSISLAQAGLRQTLLTLSRCSSRKMESHTSQARLAQTEYQLTDGLFSTASTGVLMTTTG